MADGSIHCANDMGKNDQVYYVNGLHIKMIDKNHTTIIYVSASK